MSLPAFVHPVGHGIHVVDTGFHRDDFDAAYLLVQDGRAAFVDTGTNFSVPRLLAEVAGAMRILERPEPAAYLEALRRYSQVELIDRAQVPGGHQLDTLADALASMEYFLETLHDPHGQRLDLLDKTRASLEALRYWPQWVGLWQHARGGSLQRTQSRRAREHQVG